MDRSLWQILYKICSKFSKILESLLYNQYMYMYNDNDVCFSGKLKPNNSPSCKCPFIGSLHVTTAYPSAF